MIRINTLYLHNVHFIFKGAGIFEDLLRGLGTEPSLRQRGFTLANADPQRGDWVIVLNGTTILLTSEELAQLCELVDLSAPYFLTAFQHREETEGTLFCEPDGLRNVRLLTIKRGLWRSILEFAHHYDYANGSSAWHIFDSGGSNHIKIVRRNGESSVTPFEAYVYGVAPSSGGNLMDPEDDVCLCWDEGESQIDSGGERSARARGWNASRTLRWIADSLIPEVLRNAKDKSSLKQWRQWGGTEEQPRYYRETWGADAALFTSLDSWRTLLNFTDAVQVHYNEHPHDPVPRTVIESAFSGLLLLTEVSPERAEALEYIAQKLRVPNSGELGSIVSAGRQRLLAHASFDGSDVDHVFRVAGAVLDSRNQNPRFPVVSTETVVAAWQKLRIAVQFEAIRYRALARIEQPASR